MIRPMEKNKAQAVLEICSDGVGYAIGYRNHDRVALLYYRFVRIDNLLEERGKVARKTELQDALRSFKAIEDPELALKVSSLSVSVVLPPLGFMVYQNNKTTNTSSQNSTIAPIDIKNAMTQLMRDPVPKGSRIVDIVPDFFVLDTGMRYDNPPLGEMSNTLTVQAKIHTLPAEFHTECVRLIEGAGFRVERTLVAPFAAARLLKGDASIPKSYVLLDIGARFATVTLVGNSDPYSSTFVEYGGSYLDEEIAASLDISLFEARSLKEKWGYNERKTGYEKPLMVVEEEGVKRKICQEDLNEAINRYSAEMSSFLVNAIKTVADIQDPKARDYFLGAPLVFTGGSTKLKGFKALMERHLTAIRPSFSLYRPAVMGGRDPSLTAIIGSFMALGSQEGALGEARQGVSNLSRER